MLLQLQEDANYVLMAAITVPMQHIASHAIKATSSVIIFVLSYVQKLCPTIMALHA